MLSDRQTQLLTAYVDGEVDGGDLQAVERLVAALPEARAFLDKLQADSKELQELPKWPAPATLSDIVMETLNDNGPRLPKVPTSAAPGSVAAPPSSATFHLPRWLGLAMAASVLVVAGVGTFFIAGMLLRTGPEIAKLDPLVDNIFFGAVDRFGDDVAGKDVGVRLALAEMQEEPVKKRLAQELKKQQGVWFDAPSANNKKAVERLTDAFNKTGLTVLLDPGAKKKLERKVTDVQFVLYAENLTRAEVTQILVNVSIVEPKAPTPTANALDLLTMRAMAPLDRDNLANVMGVERNHLEPAKWGDIPLAIELPDNQNGKKAGPTREANRFAVLLAMNGAAKTDQQSNELRQFIQSRQELRQGTLQMVFVIHEPRL